MRNAYDEATDALFDTHPRVLAERFGRRAIQQILDGRDAAATARLAASFAMRAEPSLRKAQIVAFERRTR